MQVNNWFEFAIFSLFTFAVILIGLPVSIYLLKKGVEGFRRYRFKKLPPNFLVAPGLGTYSVEVVFYGVFIFAFAIWYLFIDKGGQLLNFISEAKAFFAP
ncbi:MAG: hypothetical protein GY702_02990 [Desulfobulbaceae bacterium]|nr:hypothetical protein [Desulfobulbaceae bacterium]